MSEIKACPFCKDKMQIEDTNETYPDGTKKAWVFHTVWDKSKCAIASDFDGLPMKYALDWWQTRPVEDALREENERLKECLREVHNELAGSSPWEPQIARRAESCKEIIQKVLDEKPVSVGVGKLRTP